MERRSEVRGRVALNVSNVSCYFRLALRQLPIHRMGTLNSSKSLTVCAAIDDDSIMVGPTGGSTPIDPSWLSDAFVVASETDDDAGYDSLRVPKCSAVQWYTRDFFPSIDNFDTEVRVAVLQRLLDNVNALAVDHAFTDFLKKNGACSLHARLACCM